MGESKTWRVGASAVVVTALVAACSSADQPPTVEDDQPPATSADPDADPDAGTAEASDEAAVTLGFADGQGTIAGTLDYLSPPGPIETELRSDVGQLAVVSLTQEPAPQAAWMELTVDGRRPTVPTSGALRPVAGVQRVVVEVDGSEPVPVAVTARGAASQAAADGAPPISWQLDVAPVDAPERAELLGCWLYQSGERSFNGGLSWLPQMGGMLTLADDGTSETSDGQLAERSGQFDYDDGTLRIRDDAGEVSYVTAVLDDGTPPVGGDATLLLSGDERNITGVHFGETCTGLEEADIDPDGRFSWPEGVDRLAPAVRVPREVGRDYRSEVCRDASYPVEPDRSHLDEADAPSATELYPQIPPASGPHLARVASPVVTLDGDLDPRLAVHNLEHGAVVVWVDPDHDDADLVALWARTLALVGFHHPAGGVGVLVAPMPDGANVDGSIVFTSWGRRLVCDSFDVQAAALLVAETYGDRGDAPEGTFAPYPAEAPVDAY